MLGLREAICKKFDRSTMDLSQGIKSRFINEFYRSDSGNHTFPYNSILFFMKSLEWPRPEKLALSEKIHRSSWTEECQGVANDGSNWFFAQDKTLWKHVKGDKLSQPIPNELVSLGCRGGLWRQAYTS